MESTAVAKIQLRQQFLILKNTNIPPFLPHKFSLYKLILWGYNNG